MEDEPVDFYSNERWVNWLDRVREADLGDDSVASRLYLNLQNDTTVAIAKVLTEYQGDSLTSEEAVAELSEIQDVVLAEPELEDEDAQALIDAVQTSLLCPFMSVEQYFHDGPTDEGTVSELFEAAVSAENAEEYETALAYMTHLGTLVIDGEFIELDLAENVEYGLVTEWFGGLDSLQEALEGPQIVEDDD